MQNLGKRMIKFFLTVFIILLFFSGTECHKPPPVVPPEPTTCEYPAGNRTFTWRIDTIAWFPSTLGGVWTFSDTDAYVIGTIVDGKAPYVSRPARHWNGTVWEDSIHGTWGYDNLTEQWGDISVSPRNDVTGDDHFLVAVGYGAKTGFISAGVVEFDNKVKKWKSYEFQTRGELRSVWTDGKGYFIAVGDNGMVYIKDGYSSSWTYQKAPTYFNLNGIVGISKNEIYIHSALSLATGENYHQYWKFNGVQWLKLYDEQDTTGTIVKLQGTENAMYDIAAYRCSITDSLKLYLIGWESFLLESKGQELNYHITNLTQIGLPLRNIGRTAFRINLFSPNDLWIFGTRYNFYHWNGNDFQKIVVPGLPNDDMQFGWQGKMIKTLSGRVFLPSEVSSQVYVVVQGTPN
jgi:hypothetical protein